MDIPRYRIGNDLTVLWAICNNDGTPFDMSGKEVRLFVTNERGITEVNAKITADENSSVTNVIRWDYLGDDQKVLGKHTLTVEILTSDDHRKIKRDICDAFTLVPRSDSEETGGEGNAVDSGSIYLSTKLDVYRFGKASVEIGPNGNWFIDGTDTGKTAMGGGPGLVSNIYKESDLGKEFDSKSVIDTFNAHAINAIYSKLKNITIEDIQNILFSDVEAYDVLAFNGNTWMNIPFRTLFNTDWSPGVGGSGDSVWKIDAQGNIWTDKQVIIKNNLIIEGDTSSGDEGEDTPSAGLDETRLQEYLDEHKYVTEDDIAGLIPSNIATVDYVNAKFNSIDLSPYAKTTELNALANRVVPIETWMNNVGQHLTYDAELDAIVINHNLIVTKDTSSGGEGEDTPASGIRGIYVNNVPYTDTDGDGFIDLGTISGGTADLSNYYTKSQSDARYLALSGGILYNGVSDTPLYIKSNIGAAYIGFKNSSDAFLGHYGFNDTTPTVYIGTSAEYNIIHSGNIGIYNAGGFNVVDIRGVNPTPYNSGIEHAVTAWFNNGADTPNISSYYGGISVKGWSSDYRVWQLASSSTSYLDSDKDLWFRTGVNDTWQPWRRIVSEDDNGNVTLYGTHLYAKNYVFMNSGGEGIYLSTDAISWHNAGNGWVRDLMAFAPSGNVLIGTVTDSGYKLDVAGTGRFTGAVTMSSTLSVGGNILPSIHNTHIIGQFDNSFYRGYVNVIHSGANGNNLWLISGTHSSDIGIQFARSADGTTTGKLGSWDATGLYPATNNAYALGTSSLRWAHVNAYKYHVGGNYYTYITESGGYLDLVSYGNEMCIGTSSNSGDIHINYRKSSSGYVPSTYYWRAGSSSSYANFYLGNLVAAGDTSSGSDIRFKDIIKNKTIKIEDIAKAPLFTFKWNDREDDSIHLGSSAQYWEKVCPWLVTGEDFKSLNYATLGVAMGISLAKKAVNHEARIKELEREIKRLKEEMRYGDR